MTVTTSRRQGCEIGHNSQLSAAGVLEAETVLLQQSYANLLRSPAPGLVQMPRCNLCAAVAETALSAAVISSEPSAALAAALTAHESQQAALHEALSLICMNWVCKEAVAIQQASTSFHVV